jgi:hypothetical protein
VERLTAAHGADVKLPDLLSLLGADCPEARSVSIYDQRKAVYGCRRKDDRFPAALTSAAARRASTGPRLFVSFIEPTCPRRN